ncbi:heme ABC exporter ATP-binding protein CcmA [Parasphingopyxis marina]|uniref:Heme ABC exporter ATP-binding protein CcmA n=1 Tax=Parasphingopyxis marina TaxID=2761622 RepID=A0A842I2V8_9SPHN|nr:heme ABC exporter ATP-binding protein CcmA [Parasphingopyxis marina]MBC2779109.1 heme ABC exporter ATP-binding protein CcmA [Parasphingopyxis marina]
MTASSLILDGLGCIRGGRVLFKGVDLSLDAGDAAVATGPNGAGKTSLLRLIAGLLTPGAGSVTHQGAIAFAGMEPALDRDVALAKALAYWARIDGGGAGDIARGLDAMALTKLAEVPVRMLSAGQLKRATLARTIAGPAAIWLLDEPGNGLDRDAQARLEAAIAAHRAAGGIVVAATHQPLAMDGAVEIAIGGAA